jgi:catechol 2,3-dioxygenase-like lactoylglutathione lyase family enzyme
MAVKRMDNIGIVVDDLAATIDFFRELGLKLERRARSKENGPGVSLGAG